MRTARSPRPLELFAKLHDHLLAANCHRAVGSYLNLGGSLAMFQTIATSGSCLVAHGPEPIRKFVCNELQVQGVRHHVLTSPANLDRIETRLLVDLGDSGFLCEMAVADFEP
jgi:hypothetical protein